MSTMTKRLLIAAAILGAIASRALPAEAFDRPWTPAPKAPAQCEPGPKWIANVRLDIQGVIGTAGPHVQVLSTSAMGLSGAPAAETAGGGTSVMLTITPEDAQELADALAAWAANPTDSVIFSRQRRYPAPPTSY